MSEITQTNLNIIPAEDIEYLTKQSTAEIGKIVAAMTSLMRDTNTKVEMLESQGWFQRMCKTVTGSNRANREVIQKNNAKLGAYMAEAVSVLYDRQVIDEKLITNLGLQINRLYADHDQLKKQLGAFAEKLNKKIESVDNYHLLFEEITLGHYSDIAPIFAICEITSQLDERVMKDERRLKNLKEIVAKQEIINDEQKQITEYLNDMFALPEESIGLVAMEFSTLYDKSPIAQLLLGITENYHYLPETAKKMKKKSAIVEHVLNEYEIDDSVTFSTRDIYEDFVSAKSEVYENSVVHLSDEEISNALVADADKAIGMGDYKRALELCREAADLGSAVAMVVMAGMYVQGLGVVLDYGEAFKWLSKAADLGSADAMYLMAGMYDKGWGVAQDYGEAFKWFSKAADLGSAYAMDNLGFMYQNGNGVEQDYEKAINWYRKAADLGNADAMNNLGFMYQNGNGVKQDNEKATEWYEKAAKLGNVDAMHSMAELLTGTIRMGRLGGSISTLDKPTFQLWFDLAKKMSIAGPKARLGMMYLCGIGTEQNSKEAVNWLHKAADEGANDLGNGILEWILGWMYQWGDGTEQNPQEAFKWYNKAIEKGNPEAKKFLDTLR